MNVEVGDFLSAVDNVLILVPDKVKILIVTCSGKRSGKVAQELTDKGYCSTKGMYYYGLKLHSLAFRRNEKMPFPEQLLFTPASENDLNVFKQAWAGIENRIFYGDKIYHNEYFFDKLETNLNSVMLTPVKGIKNQSIWEKQFSKAADDFFSVAVSKCRQPIESFFNWLIEKTDFQRDRSKEYCIYILCRKPAD